MTDNFVGEKRITIQTPAQTVWRALTDPALVKQYMHGTNLETDWRVGSPIAWREAADTMTEQNWGPVLEGLRAVAER